MSPPHSPVSPSCCPMLVFDPRLVFAETQWYLPLGGRGLRVLTGVQVGSSFCSSSLSSDWQILCLSPQRPAYSWKVHTMAATACSRGRVILTVTK